MCCVTAARRTAAQLRGCAAVWLRGHELLCFKPKAEVPFPDTLPRGIDVSQSMHRTRLSVGHPTKAAQAQGGSVLKPAETSLKSQIVATVLVVVELNAAVQAALVTSDASGKQ